MPYTVKELAKLSGVSVRTLHFYDEIGLLMPAFHGENGYRYYEEEQLLKLQQILFFRELDFRLKEIQKIVGRSDFDQLKALLSHRKVLEKRQERIGKLLTTIDKTVKRIKGERNMFDEEIYTGFSKEKQKEYEQYLINRNGQMAEDLISESKKRTKHWKKEDADAAKAAVDGLHREFIDALGKGLSPNSDEVQKIVKGHYQWIQQFYEPTKEVYAGLGDLYNEHPDFRKMYDSYHPELAEFLKAAMKYFAKEQL